MLSALFVSIVCVVLVLWQDGIRDCPDGLRYTSGRQQPHPFSRRFTWWPKKLLTALTLLCGIGVATTLGGWQHALLFMTLPGVVFVLSRPACVDLVGVALAWGAALAAHGRNLPVAIGLSLLGGLVHERVPVFASLYAGNPLLLIGLCSVRWFGRRGSTGDNHPSADALVNLGTWQAIRAHKKFHDWLQWGGWFWPTRGLPLIAAFYGVPPRAWLAFGVAHLTRLLGTDSGRFLIWGAVPLIAALPREVALWMVLLQVFSIRRLP